MKKLILIIIFLSFLQAKAQTSVYHPFPDSNAVWNVNTWFCCYGGCPPPPTPNPLITQSYFTYFLFGDTMINNNNYSKVYLNGYSHEYCVTGGNVSNWTYYDSIYFGGLREDIINKKIYYITSLSLNECLLYDFNLNIGDTLQDDCQLQIYGIVINIDSILIGSAYRKKINLSVGPPFSLIEGIGTTAGLFERLYDFEAGSSLLCFKQNNQTLYPDTTTTCELITVSVPDVGNELQDLNIFPNPTFEEINLSFKLEEPAEVKFQLFNSLGQVVNTIAEEKLNAGKNKIKISVEDIPIGVYYLKIHIGESEIVKKVIKI